MNDAVAAASLLTAVEVAERAGQTNLPTRQQQAVIEAGLEPALVVAGAGSGKTETMANRVVWLVANGLAEPGEILGLTFTRKAAGELGMRIRTRLAQLPGRGADGAADPLEQPTASTYNAFANALYRDNAMLIGREPDGAVLTEASAWQIADRLVRESRDPRLVELGKSVASVTQAVLDLAHALSDNVVADLDEVRRTAQDFAGVLALEGYRGNHRKTVREAVERVSALPVLVDLAEQYAAEKRRLGYLEFSDQVAFALAALERVPAVAADYRSRYKIVLLDEYQDTSVVQTRLLSALFRGTAVMAVGDPNQSIYGWRGASAANLQRFAHDFSVTPAAVPVFPLMTSWRNPERVLEAANIIAAPLNAAATEVTVEALQARPGAQTGELQAVWCDDVLSEAASLAGWFRGHLDAARAAAQEPPTAALLCRSLKRIGPFTAALDTAGVPYHVLGVGGLLEEPVIVDLVCALTVLVDPDAGSELLRLLAGARWRVGARDLKALRALASELARRDWRLQRLDQEVADRLRESVLEDDGASIVDALDVIASSRKDDGPLFAAFSPEGLARLRECGRLLARLRTRTGLELMDLVAHVVQELGLDIEVQANERAVRGRASLDAFYELAAGFVAADGSGSGLRAFLGWLEQAERRERLTPRSEPPEAGTVQILTVHGSKGLEWELVAVPRLVAGELPGSFTSGQGWTAFGQLPDRFRGDAAELPVLDWRSATTQKEVEDAMKRYAEELAERHAGEERRLAYVAATRASRALLLTGSAWSTQSKPRGPSTYLLELSEAGLLPGVEFELPGDDEQNPVQEAMRESVQWPHDPLGSRRERVLAAAEAVRAARERRANGEPGPLDDGGPWVEEIDRLLVEREHRASGVAEGVLPLRISASRYKDFVSDRDRTLRGLVRPVPDRPYRQTRLGTLFHGWVEEQWGLAGTTEIVDVGMQLGFDDDDDERYGFGLFEPGLAELSGQDERTLARFKETFLASEWAGLKPVAVEQEIHLPLAGRVFVCKIDAVYEREGRIQIVDWKTGKAPADAEDLERKQFQLALYRAAYCAKHGVSPSEVDALFYFVAEDRIIRPERIYGTAELERLWSGIYDSTSEEPVTR